MVGPWWYHTATSVPRVRNLPFSVLRMLILRGRLACADGTVRSERLCRRIKTLSAKGVPEVKKRLKPKGQ